MGCCGSKHTTKQVNKPISVPSGGGGGQTAAPAAKYENKDTTPTITIHEGESALLHRLALYTKETNSTLNEKANCYFFGYDDDEIQKAVKFDPNTEEFIPVKVPQSLDIFSLSSCAYESEETMFITGGANQQLTEATKKAFYYNAKDNQVKRVPEMTQERYGHSSVSLDSKLYVLGGYNIEKPKENGEENEIVLKHCERYDMTKGTWEKIADLNLPRALFSCIIYDGVLHVLGGYVGGQKRTRTIEKYDPEQNKWTLLNEKLPQSLETSFITSQFEDSLFMIGGLNLHGHTNANYVYDLKDDVYVCRKHMHKARVLHKGFAFKNKIYVFGGDQPTEDDDEDDQVNKNKLETPKKGQNGEEAQHKEEHTETLEVYDISKNEWTLKTNKFSNLILNMGRFCCSQPTVNIRSGKVNIEKASQPKKNESKCYLFGHDGHRFIAEIDFTCQEVREKPIPTNLKLHCYQAIIKLDEDYYFLAGGADEHIKYLSSKAYLYSPDRNIAKKLDKMSIPRYAFNLVKTEKYVYALGGRNYGEDQDAILSKCERYCLKNNKWEDIADMNNPRCSANAFLVNDILYIGGGYRGDQSRWHNIERYIEKDNKWEVFKYEFINPLEGCAVLKSPKEGSIILLGGRGDEGDHNYIYEFSTVDGSTTIIGNLKESKCLLKAYEYENQKVCVFGGHVNFTEFIDLKKDGGHIENPFSHQIEKAIGEITSIKHDFDKKLTKCSLA